MKVLIVLTSHDELGNTGEKTGFWLEEFASPYYRLKDAGAHVTLASPNGGQPPLDPKSHEPDAQTDATRRFDADPAAQKELANTATDSIARIEAMIAAGKPVAAVCHAPAVLLKARDKNGEPLVKGKQVTGFSNSEESAVDLTDVVPYLLQDQLVALGGVYQKVDDWSPLAVVDGLVITGQNPGSSEAVADVLLKAIS
jgi:putative intracellular protease/amidase